jgi:hypothetical protein
MVVNRAMDKPEDSHSESYASRLKREGREKIDMAQGQRTEADKMLDELKDNIRRNITGYDPETMASPFHVRTETSDGRKIKHPASPEAMARLSQSLYADGQLPPFGLDKLYGPIDTSGSMHLTKDDNGEEEAADMATSQLFAITDEMIAAGASVLLHSPSLQWSQGRAESVAEAVLLAASNPERARLRIAEDQVPSVGRRPLFP